MQTPGNRAAHYSFRTRILFEHKQVQFVQFIIASLQLRILRTSKDDN